MSKLLVAVSVTLLISWVFMWGTRGGVGRVEELAFLVVSFVVVSGLVRLLCSDSNLRTLSELRPYLVPLGWAVGLSAMFLVAETWKPLEYITMPVPVIVLAVVLLRRRRRRREKLV